MFKKNNLLSKKVKNEFFKSLKEFDFEKEQQSLSWNQEKLSKENGFLITLAIDSWERGQYLKKEISILESKNLTRKKEIDFLDDRIEFLNKQHKFLVQEEQKLKIQKIEKEKRQFLKIDTFGSELEFDV